MRNSNGKQKFPNRKSEGERFRFSVTGNSFQTAFYILTLQFELCEEKLCPEKGYSKKKTEAIADVVFQRFYYLKG